MRRPPPRPTLFPYTTLFRSFNANGRTIYFDSLDRATTNPSLIYRMGANGTGRRLSDSPSAPTHVWPTVSRGGSTLRSEEHTSELQSRRDLVCRLLLEKKNQH